MCGGELDVDGTPRAQRFDGGLGHGGGGVAVPVVRTISSPSSQRMVSISCTIESVMIISEVKVGGATGLRCAQCTTSGAPTSPLSSRCLTAA